MSDPLQESDFTGTDYRSGFDSSLLRVWDLNGRPKIVTIKAVKQGLLRTKDGTREKKPVVYFVEFDRPLVLNKTNGATVAALHTTNPKNWPGKKLTLYPTTTSVGGKTVDCIRIENKEPK